MNLKNLRLDLKNNSEKQKALIYQKFFKTGKDEYGEGDVFLGINVPKQKTIAKKYYNINLEEIQKLLNSKIHEERFTALIILIKKYENAKKQNNEKEQKNIFNFYLNNTKNINNWDLVDVSAPKIVGDYLLYNKKERKILNELSNSKKGKGFEDLWKKRVAILATFAFIKNNEFKDTIKLAEKYLKEEHDLLHKATGWMLRELGKKDEKALKKFLDENYNKMPRTILRYAIEKFDEKERKYYLKK
jgi:3-methyladenine DNA glycosylase AlkD